MGSKFPAAMEFEKRVVEDVLPMIRKTGGYISQEKAEDILNDPDLIIEIVTQVKELRAAVVERDQKIKEYKPQVAFANV